MTSLPKSIPAKPHSSYSFTTNARAGPGPSTRARSTSAKPVPDTKDKEEGEISDGDDEELMEGPPRPPSPRRPATPPRRRSSTKPRSQDKHSSRRGESSSRHSHKEIPPRPPNVATPPIPTIPLPLTPEIKVEVKIEPHPKGAKVETSEEVLRSLPPAVASTAVEEMDIIRNLLNEQIPPADLIGGGANERYVRAVCQDILISRMRASQPAIISPRPRKASHKKAKPSPSTSHRSTQMDRKPSMGSEASEERLVDILMGPASPKGGSAKMVASSSWHPPDPPPPPLGDLPPPPPPIRSESYRPPTPPGRPPPNAPTSLSSSSSASSTTLTATMQNFHPLSSYSGSASPRQQNPYLPPLHYPELPAPTQNPYLQVPNHYQSAPPPNPYLQAPPQEHRASQSPNPYLQQPPPPPQQNPYLPLSTPPRQNPYLPQPVPPGQNPYFPVSAPPQQQPYPPPPQSAPPRQPNPYLPQPPPPPFSLPPKPMAGPVGMIAGGPFGDGGHSQNGYSPHPVAAPFSYSDQPVPLPVPEPTPSPRLVEAELAARTALLETRRKAFESMKRRREANRPAASAPPALDAPPVIDLTLDDDVSIVVDSEDDEALQDKTIEEQMAQLEQEVMGLQTEQAAMQDDIDMELEGTEDGEIEDDIQLPATPPISIPSLPTASAVKIPRGTKRANAEDMMDSNRPTTLPARLPPNKRRSLFGGMPQRPNRLVMLLDHSDSDSDDDDDDDTDKAERMSKLKITSGNSTPISDTARLLAEKEEGIRKLREQIEKRMKARIVKKVPGEGKKKEVVEVTAVVEVKDIEMATAVEHAVVEEVKDAETSKPVGLGNDGEETQSELAKLVEGANVQPTGEDVDMTASSGPIEGTIAIEPSSALVDSPAPDSNDDLPILEVNHLSPISVDPELTNAPQQTSTSHFHQYSPILFRYPQLRPPSTSSRPDSLVQSSDIDQSLLSSIVLTRRLKKEPEAVLCAAEAAGGSCADASCGDIHLVKGVLSDDDLAEYLSHVYPGKSTTDILAKLAEARSASLSTGRATPRRRGRGGKSTPVASVPSAVLVDDKELLARVGRLLAGE